MRTLETPEELTQKLRELCAPNAREQLISRGLARGMIWEKGTLPEGSPAFSTLLTNDLLSHGYLLLGCAIRLKTLGLSEVIPDSSVLDTAFRNAAESIEAAVRRGEPLNDRGFHLTVAAAAFHLGHYAARAFSLIAETTTTLNLVHVELLLVALMQRRLDQLQSLCLQWLADERNTDDGIARLLELPESTFDASAAAYTAISRVFHGAMSVFEFALRSGKSDYVVQANKMLDRCIAAADQLKHVPLWWITVLARHLIDDLWERSLYQTLPITPENGDRWPELRQNFIELLCSRDVAEIDLWPSQLEAAQRVIDETDSLVVALPTSSGKTRIAELCILKCLAGARRVLYVTPLRALSAQVEITLSRTFKPLGFSVSSVYGASGIAASDVDTMKSTSIVVATPEKLDFAIRQDPSVIDDVGLIVLDEGHMIGLSEREIRYEVLVQRLLRRPDSNARRIVCLSAIFTEGEPFDAFTKWIRSDKDGNAIRSDWRPTRQRPATLEWRGSAGRLEYRVLGETVFVPRFIEEREATGRRQNAFPQNRHELIAALVQRFHYDGHSVLVYCPIRKSVEPTAESILKLVAQGYLPSFLSSDATEKIATAIRIGEEWLGSGHVAIRALRLGIGVHHGQLPRPFLAEIESLLRRRVLSVAISSPTLAQGVDLSFGVLIFTSLWRNQELLKPKEFANVIGRVGRAFVDLDGIFILPVYESNAAKRSQRLREFHKLVIDARGRELESGLYLLIFVCLWRLKQTLHLEGNELEDYVLNQQSAIDDLASGDDEDSKQMELILAELDAGIFALVENLECDASEVATKLDEALQNSLWRRRLAVRGLEEQQNQVTMLHGRARHIWKRTTTRQRKGFFAASIGTESGLQLVEQRKELQRFLELATEGIISGQTDQLVQNCCSLAERLFEIHPFQPDMPNDWDEEAWKAILEAWISGVTLYRATDATGIAFVQDALVFRLVWAIEAVRVVLSELDENPDGDNSNDDRTFVALCMTYGVPTVSAARLLERGMESRLLAVKLTKELALNFTSQDELSFWLIQLGDDAPIHFSETERAVWQRFIRGNDHSFQSWERQTQTCAFRLRDGIEVTAGADVRLLSNETGIADIYTPDFRWLGTTATKLPPNRTLIGVTQSSSILSINNFGPLELPEWLKDLLATR